MGNEPRSRLEAPLFFNELGVNSIEIGVAAFHCMGVMPPHDHPHVYLNMGDETDILCSYCSTEYRFNAALSWNETIPANCWAAATKQIPPIPQAQRTVRHFGTVKSFDGTTGHGSICPSRAGGLIGFQKGAALWKRSVDPVSGQRLSYELVLTDGGARAVKLRNAGEPIEAHAHV